MIVNYIILEIGKVEQFRKKSQQWRSHGRGLGTAAPPQKC